MEKSNFQIAGLDDDGTLLFLLKGVQKYIGLCNAKVHTYYLVTSSYYLDSCPLCLCPSIFRPMLLLKKNSSFLEPR